MKTLGVAKVHEAPRYAGSNYEVTDKQVACCYLYETERKNKV